MAVTRTFKGSKNSYSCGYYAYIEDNQLVIGYDGPREGGVLYRGDYEGASDYLKMLGKEAPKLCLAIKDYYMLKASDNKKPSNSPSKTYKVRLTTRNNCVYNCLVKGPDEETVIKELCPSTPKALVIQNCEATTFVIYSDMIMAIEFDNSTNYNHSLRI